MTVEEVEHASIDLDAEVQNRWVLEVMYTGSRLDHDLRAELGLSTSTNGTLRRYVFDDSSLATERFEFARDRASTDWQKLYKVTITVEWEKVEKSES